MGSRTFVGNVGLGRLLLAVAATALLTAHVIEAQVPATPAAAAADTADRIFRLRCSTCHTEEPGYAPTRLSLATRSHSAIVAALTTGSMRPMATGLGNAEIAALASYLTSGSTAAAAGQSGPEQGFCTGAPPPFSPTAGDWNGWARDTRSSRFQPEPGFRAQDVPRLRVKWAFALDGGMHSQPTVVGGRVFVSSVPGRLFSLDAESGCIYWAYQTAPGAGDDWGGAGSRSTVVVGQVPGTTRYAAFIGDDLAHVHAIDVATGERIWRTQIDEHPVARVTGSSVLHNGVLYVPLSSIEEAAAGTPEYECCTFRGSIVALDAATGQIRWKSHTIAQEPRPYRTSSAGAQLHGPAGGPIWSTPTVDPSRGLLYAATGNSYTEVEQEGANAIVAFDLATGAVRWRRQVLEDDNYIIDCPRGVNCPTDPGPDFDFGSSPILQRLPDGRELLVIGNKGGIVFGMDPDREGEIVWTTQVGAGSALGGVQWGSAADDELVYVAVSDYAAPPTTRRPGLTALRPATGEVVWHTPAPPPSCSWPERVRCSNSISAALTAVPGVLFSGSLDGNIRAFSTTDGSLLWSFDTARLYDTVNGRRGHGGSLDTGGATVVGGTLYLTSGYGRFGRHEGNVLLAFTVGGR